jgi:hypothetical protein
LASRTRKQIISPHDISHLLLSVINDHSQLIGGLIVFFPDNKIAQLLPDPPNAISKKAIVNRNLSVLRCLCIKTPASLATSLL